MQTIISRWEWVSRSAKGLGPYLMLEILMPGGTLLALLLFLYQRYRQKKKCLSRCLMSLHSTEHR